MKIVRFSSFSAQFKRLCTSSSSALVDTFARDTDMMLLMGDVNPKKSEPVFGPNCPFHCHELCCALLV
jgi:uncharacterized protein (DUF2225 family)